MSGIAYSYQVPGSVVLRVLSEAWSSPLTTTERITLMTSSALVNKEWASIFTFLSHRDIHVPSTSYLIQKLHPILQGQVKSEPDLRTLCRSISMSIEYATVTSIDALRTLALTVPTSISIPGCADEPPMGHTLRALLSSLAEADTALPNLRTLSIEFVNIGLDDVFVNDRFFRFPGQVTDLVFTFTHSPLVSTSRVETARANQVQHDFSRPTGMTARMDQTLRGAVGPCFPSVRKLRIVGGSEATIADTVSQCPHLETLEVDIAGKPHPSLISTHLVSLCNLPAPLHESVAVYPAMPVLAIKSGPCDMSPEVWCGVRFDPASGLRQFCRRRPALVDVEPRSNRFMAKAKRPFSRLFSSSLSRRKSSSSY